MSSKALIKIDLMAMEIIKECLTATPGVYGRFKMWLSEEAGKSPEFDQFAKRLIDYIDKYRTTIDGGELRLFSIMDEYDCDMDTAGLLLQEEIEGGGR